MMKHRRHPSAGFSLIELMTSLAIMTLAVVATSFMLIEGSRMARNAEEIAQSNENARLSAEYILNSARLAGFGASGGIWINQGGTARNINPVFGTDADGGSDSIWMVVPGRNILREACVAPGSVATVVSRGPSSNPISVNCTNQVVPLISDGGVPANFKLLAGDLNQASLLTGVTVVTPSDGRSGPGAITYSGGGVVPPRGVFNPGDLIYPARILHFFVQRGSDAGTGLYFVEADVNPIAPPALPFVDPDLTLNSVLVSREVEDMQITYGIDPNRTGNPNSYSFVHGFDPTPVTGRPLKALRLNVVARGKRVSIRGDGAPSREDPTFWIESRRLVYPTDGFRRSLYQRRIEPPNLNPGAL